MSKEKNIKIQFLRGLAIIAVIMIHTCPDGITQVIVRPFINYAVALFLFLSGYLTDLNNIDWYSFYKKRILRVVIPYLIWSIIYTSLTFFNHGINLNNLLLNIISTKSASTLYYIFVYIQFVLITPILKKIINSKYRWIGWIISPLFILVKYYWLIFDITPNDIIASFWNICCLWWFLYYYLGLYLRNYKFKKEYRIQKVLLVYFASIIIQLIEGYSWYKTGDINCGTQLKMSSYLTSSLFILLSYWFINNKCIITNNSPIIIIGNYSFGIYITHILILIILKKIPFWSQIPFIINSTIVLIISLLFVFVGSKIFGKKISRLLGLN